MKFQLTTLLALTLTVTAIASFVPATRSTTDVAPKSLKHIRRGDDPSENYEWENEWDERGDRGWGEHEREAHGEEEEEEEEHEEQAEYEERLHEGGGYHGGRGGSRGGGSRGGGMTRGGGSTRGGGGTRRR